MIIFDLSTLADDSHRRHFINPNECHNFEKLYELVPDYEMPISSCRKSTWLPQKWIHKFNGENWQPDYQAYYDAIDKDTVIAELKEMKYLFATLKRGRRGYDVSDIFIWTDRIESYREKTIKWLTDNQLFFDGIKMRPENNKEPYHQLKENWLKESQEKIEMAFDNDEESIKMWRKNGIFCFDCRQE